MKRLLLLGLILRVGLLFLDFSFDSNSFIAWVKELDRFGFPGFYERVSLERYSTIYPNYPPLQIFFFYLSYHLSVWIKNLVLFLNFSIPIFPSNLVFMVEKREFLAGILKLSPLLADLGIAILIYLFVKKTFKKDSLLAASLVLFNPVFFYVSSYWGQTESVAIFFVMISFYSLFFWKNHYLPAVFFTLSILSKQTALVFLPVFAIIFLKKYGLKNSAKSTILSLGIFYLMFLPFYSPSLNLFSFPFETYGQKILAVSGIPFVSNHAFNFWALITQWKDINDLTPFILGLSYRIWSIVLMAIFAAVILYRLIRSKVDNKTVFLAAYLFAFTVFLFLTRIHERHFIQVLPFLIPLAIKDKKIMKIFLLLSFVSIVNLYHNWPAKQIQNEFLISLVRTPIARNVSIFAMLFSYIYTLKIYLKQQSKA